MMKNKKFALVSVLMLSLLSLLFTACNFGKDDFYGTWQSGTFARPSDGKTIRVTFYFSGKSENLTKGGSAYFYEIYENIDDDLNTFWWGTYSLGANQDITNGTLTLKYMYGVGYKDKGIEYTTLEACITASNKKKVAEGASGFESLLNSISASAARKFDQYDTGSKKCSDVEKFDFKLDGAVPFQGYTQMVCTAMCQWDELEGSGTGVTAAASGTKKAPASGTSWGKEGATRSFTLTSNNGNDYGDTMDLVSNSIFAGSLPVLNTVSEYAEVALTPEK